MSLLTRLVDPQPGEVKIPIHQFMSALAEYKRGAPGVNLDSIAEAFALSPSEKTKLQEFLTNLDSDTINRAIIHDVLLMGEGEKLDGSGDHFYPISVVKSRLGIT